MMQGHEPKIDEFLNGLCRVSLEILPFEGAMIILLKRDRSAFERFGGSGIFDLTKAQQFLGKTSLSEQSDYFIPNEIHRLLSNGVEIRSQTNSLIREYSMPGAERVGVVKNAQAVEEIGLRQFENIYKQGEHVRVPVALPLYHLNGSRGDVVGLFLLNNLRTVAEMPDDTQLLLPLLASTLSAFIISRILSEKTDGKRQGMQVPSKEQFMRRILKVSEVAGKHSALKLASADRDDPAMPASELVRLGLTVAIATIVMAAMIGVEPKTAWTLLATLGGVGAGSFLIYHAQTTRRGAFSSIPLYIAGFILIFEFVLFIATITSTVNR